MEPNPTEIPNELVTVGRYRRARQANDDTLLILSMGVAYWMVPVEQGYEVLVQPAVAEQVMEQLERSRRENRFWPPQPMDAPSSTGRVHTVAFIPFAGVLIALFIAQQLWGEVLTEAGRLDVQAVRQSGQWWRTLTALTLHADGAHLIGNLGMGCFFSLFVVQQYGARVAWLLILLSGTLGNGMNVLLHGDEAFYAIGASTAVFAAVGILAGAALRRLLSRGVALSTRDVLLPIFVALGVLGWWGSSGENTDFMGHLLGLFAGILLGTLDGWIRSVNGEWVRRTAALVGAILLAGAWLCALMIPLG